MSNITDRKVLKDEQVIFRESEPATKAFLIVQGESELFKLVGQNQKQISICKAGSFIGVNALVNGSKHTATAKVKGGAAIIPVSQEALQAQINKMDKLTRNVIQSVVGRLNELLDGNTQ